MSKLSQPQAQAKHQSPKTKNQLAFPKQQAAALSKRTLQALENLRAAYEEALKAGAPMFEIYRAMGISQESSGPTGRGMYLNRRID